jgi:hypothetical protein
MYVIYSKQELYFFELFAYKFVIGVCYWKAMCPSSPYLHVSFPLFIHSFIRSKEPHVAVQPTDTEQVTIFCIGHISLSYIL